MKYGHPCQEPNRDLLVQKWSRAFPSQYDGVCWLSHQMFDIGEKIRMVSIAGRDGTKVWRQSAIEAMKFSGDIAGGIAATTWRQMADPQRHGNLLMMLDRQMGVGLIDADDNVWRIESGPDRSILVAKVPTPRPIAWDVIDRRGFEAFLEGCYAWRTFIRRGDDNKLIETNWTPE